MDAEKIETLLRNAGVNFERISERVWNLLPGAARSIDATLVCISGTFRKSGDLLKIHSPVCHLSPDTTKETMFQIFRKNRDMGHGAFALRDDNHICYVDTLELDRCDQNEMEATLDWAAKSCELFKSEIFSAYLET